MDIEEIKNRVRLIDEVSDDYERAHGKEDELYMELLEYIRHNAPDPFSAMAAEALKTQDIDFPRYCA